MAEVLRGAAPIWLATAVSAARNGNHATALGLLMSIDARSWQALRGGEHPAPHIDPAAAIWFEDAVRALQRGDRARADVLWKRIDEASREGIRIRMEDLGIVLLQLAA